MLRTNFAGYVGKMEEGSFVGYTGGLSFFCILEVLEGYSEDRGSMLIGQISEKIAEQKPQNLQEFDETISNLVQKTDLPVDFSLAAGYIISGVLYLKTIGTGEIYVKRGHRFEQIISGDTTASGYPVEQDLFIFATSLFMDGAQGKDDLNKILHHKKNPDYIVAKLREDYKVKNKETSVALFVLFEKSTEKKEEIPTSSQQLIPVMEKKEARLHFSAKHILTSLYGGNKKRMALFLGIVLIFLVLILNAGRLFGKKQQNTQEVKMETVREKIAQDLKSLDMETNLERSLGVISASRQSLADLKKTNKSLKKSEVDKIEELITRYEAKVLNREDKNATVFFDLAVEEKGAKGDRMSLSGDKLFLLNREGKIYILSLNDNSVSIEKKVFGEIANAQLISAYESTAFFYKQGAGIYKIENKDKPKLIIEEDKEWGDISDISIYNGNIYLLDKGKDEVYKYLVAQGGYSEKNSYFQAGNSLQLQSANSLSIDSAIYIGFDSFIAKYLSGIKEDFKALFPDSSIKLVKSFTDKNLSEIYSWDKSKGIIYIIGKDGEYIKQIKSSDLMKAQDFVVYKTSIYLLDKSNILKIDL